MGGEENMYEENVGQTERDEQKKIVLSKEVQKDLMNFFLKTSIPRKKRLEQARLSNSNDGSEQ